MTVVTDWHHENGFDFSLLPAKSGKAAKLVIVMHGHGSNAANWQEACARLSEQIPDADIINLQGPLKTKDGGFTWAPYQGSKIEQVKQSVSMVFNHLPVVDQLNSFIDAQLKKRNLGDSDCALLGSSMGGIAALQAGFNREQKLAAVVSHSGALLPFTKVKSKPDILLIMGGKDEVFCKKKGMLKRAFNAVSKHFSLQHCDTVRRLRKRRVSFSERFYPQLKHEVTEETLKEAGSFINNALRRKDKLKR